MSLQNELQAKTDIKIAESLQKDSSLLLVQQGLLNRENIHIYASDKKDKTYNFTMSKTKTILYFCEMENKNRQR